ncbi:MAG: hypothetical protein ACRDVZ_08110 [Jiangellaceae bacterium]
MPSQRLQGGFREAVGMLDDPARVGDARPARLEVPHCLQVGARRAIRERRVGHDQSVSAGSAPGDVEYGPGNRGDRAAAVKHPVLDRYLRPADVP